MTTCSSAACPSVPEQGRRLSIRFGRRPGTVTATMALRVGVVSVSREKRKGERPPNNIGADRDLPVVERHQRRKNVCARGAGLAAVRGRSTSLDRQG
jgi:hypothetical protein